MSRAARPDLGNRMGDGGGVHTGGHAPGYGHVDRKQVPIGADDDVPVQKVSESPPSVNSATRFHSPRPMLVG